MCEELEHLAHKPLDRNGLEAIGEMVDIVKDIEEISEKEQGYSYGDNSYRGNYNQGSIARMYPVYGYSFERGRGEYAPRDSQGRYMDGGNSMNGGYSRDNGYYAGGSNTKDELKKLMEHATNETEKEAIRVAIESMNN